MTTPVTTFLNNIVHGSNNNIIILHYILYLYITITAFTITVIITLALNLRRHTS